ncbi:TonB-dependent receptor [bacterium SCSIO 12741]|nr:TonB-dependent receptor [bacterium SCSIO 12741]
MQKLVLAVLLSTVFGLGLWGQGSCEHVLQGAVSEDAEQAPIPFAGILLVETSRGTVSDSLGRFELTNICPGQYTLVVSHLGCEPDTQFIQVFGDLRIEVKLAHNHQWLDGYALVEEREQELSTLPQQTLSEREMQESMGQSLGEGLQKLTGVTSLSTGNSIQKPVIHGLHSNRVLILNNGIRQEGQQWGSEHAPEVDPLANERISVIKGAAAVRYGSDAIAGAVILEPAALRTSPGIDGKIHLAGFSNGRQGVVSGVLDGQFAQIQGLSWRIQGTAKKSGNVHTPDDHLENTGFEELDFSWAVGWKRKRFYADVFYSQFNTKLGIFKGSHLGNMTDLRKAFEAGRPVDTVGFSYEISAPYQQVEHELFKARAGLQTGEHHGVEVIYGRQYNRRREYDSHGLFGRSKDAPALELELTTHTLEGLWNHHNEGPWRGKIGGSVLSQDNTYGGRFFIPNYKKEGFGFFWLERLVPDSSVIEWELGIRYDYQRQAVYVPQDRQFRRVNHQFSQFSGNLGALIKAGKKLRVRVNTGSAWRPPQVNEMYSNGLHHGAAAVEFGDSTLTSETAYFLTVSNEYKTGKLRVDWDLYSYYFDGFIYSKPEPSPVLTIRGAFPAFRYTQVDAWLMGSDLQLIYNLPFNLEYRGKASLLRAWEVGRDFLNGMPADRMEHTLEYSFKNNSRIRDAYVSLGVLHVFKQSRIPPNSDFVEPPEAYTLLNAQLGLALYFGDYPIQLGVGVKNLLNTRYRDYLNRFRYYSDDLGTQVSFRITVPFTLLKNDTKTHQ